MIRQAVLLLTFLCSIQLNAQNCSCVNCPQLVPKGGSGCTVREFLYFVNGASANELSDPGQGVCGVTLDFKADYIFQIEMLLISPAGDTVWLLGPDVGTGFSSTGLSKWNVSFLPTAIVPFPDPGFSDQFTNYDPWQIGANYTGSYHPYQGNLEDFDNGPVNGPWKLVVKNCSELNKAEVIDFSIIFCDETDIECGCLAYAGYFAGFNLIKSCVGSSVLDLDIKPNFAGYEPDSLLFNYTFAIAAGNNDILEFTSNPNLQSYGAGTYKVCGLSYLAADSLSIPWSQLDLKLDSLYSEINSTDPLYCADLAYNCLFVDIEVQGPPTSVTLPLCEGSCINIAGTNYCNPGTYGLKYLGSNGCDSLVNMTLVLQINVSFTRNDTICFGEFAILGNDFYNKTGTYISTFKSYAGCDSTVTLNLVVIDPNVTINPIDDIDCFHETVLIQSSVKSNFDFNYQWTASNGGLINGVSDSEDYLADQAGSYTVLVSFKQINGKVCSSTATIDLIGNLVLPELSSVPDQFICEGDELNLLGIGIYDLKNLGGILTFHSGLPATILNQVSSVYQKPNGNTAFYAYYVAGGCDTYITIPVFVNKEPRAEIIPVIKLCNKLGSNPSPLIDLSSLIISGDASGYWEDTNSSGASGSLPVLDFNGVNPGTYVFRYFTQSAVPPCQDTIYSIDIIVEDCSCPSIAVSSPPDLCQSVVDFNLTPLIITNQTGSWSTGIVPSGSSIALLGNSLQLNNTISGNYALIFTLSNVPPPGCPQDVTVNFKVVSPVSLSLLDTISVCNSVDMGNSTILNLNIAIAVGATNGFWKDITIAGTTGNLPSLNFANVPPGAYPFQYITNSGNTVCGEKIDTVIVEVLNCECPNPQLLAGLICNTEIEFDLSALVQNPLIGTWSLLSAPPGPNPGLITVDKFQVKDKNSGTYVLNFQLASPLNNCPNNFSTNFDVISGPSTLLDTLTKVCNSSSNGSAILDFNALIKSGDKLGTWTNIQGVPTSGLLPVLDFTNVTSGSYTFSYQTNSASFPCNEITYFIKVIVENCDCPSLATIPFPKLCNDGSAIDLGNYLLTTESGTWAIVNTPSGSNSATISNGFFDPFQADPGNYLLQYNLSVPPPFGCPKFTTQSLNLLAAPNAILENDVTLCNTDTNPVFSSIIDLTSLILSGDLSGIWKDLSGSNAAGNLPVLDFKGILPGTYLFEYSAQGQTPCGNFRDTIAVVVIDCNCPGIFISAVGKQCNIGALDLAGFVSTGTMLSLNSVPAGQSTNILNGSILELTDVIPGIYAINGVLTNAPNGCPFVEIELIEVIARPKAGQVDLLPEFCLNEFQDIKLFDYISNYDLGGVWKSLNSNLNISTNGIISLLVSEGSYLVQYIVSGNQICPSDTLDLNINVNALPIGDAGVDQEISCGVTSVSLGNPLNGTISTGLFFWEGPSISDPNAPNILVDNQGIYTLTITDIGNSCIVKDTVVVSLDINFLNAEVSITYPECNSNEDVSAKVSIISGQAPFSYQLDNNGPVAKDIFGNLSVGFHTIIVQDANGCEDTLNFDILPFSQQFLNLGPDTIVDFGTLLDLTPIIFPDPSTISSISWSSNTPFIGTGKDLGIQYLAFKEGFFTLTIQTNEGCVLIDHIKVFVKKDINLFVPNAFSPNNDQVNDRVLLAFGDQIKSIEAFRIFDRWGNQVYELTNISQSPSELWDGSLNGQIMNAGVFVWYAEILLIDGSKQIISGDLTLFR